MRLAAGLGGTVEQDWLEQAETDVDVADEEDLRDNVDETVAVLVLVAVELDLPRTHRGCRPKTQQEQHSAVQGQR